MNFAAATIPPKGLLPEGEEFTRGMKMVSNGGIADPARNITPLQEQIYSTGGAVAQSLSKQCQRCLMLEHDVDAANRTLEGSQRANKRLMDEIQILTRERDELKTIVDSVGYVSCEPTGINTTNCQE